MIATTRYNLALLGHSQRYLPPVLAFLAVLALQYTDHSVPLLPEFAVSAGALLVAACWLTVALLDIEDPTQRLITLSHTRRLGPVLAGAVLTVLGCAVVLAVVSEVWAVLEHHHGTARELGFGMVAHLACACTGIAIGLPCSRLLVNRIGWTVVAALAALVVVLLAPWIPLVHPLVSEMVLEQMDIEPLLLAAVSSSLVLVLSAVVVGTLVRRRN